MPMPKLSLGLQLEPAAQSINMAEASMRFNDDGLTVLTNSYNPVSFTSEGMMRNNDGLSYKISEKDLKVTKKLGQGASGIVHKGFFVRENIFVAVKKINVYERDTRHQMLNDIKALCDAPNVPGLVKFYGAYHVPESGQISIVLEYLDGGSLADVQVKVGKIPEDILSRITAKILSALSYLHKEKHMVHRDIKPANILMNLNGEPKITDFGISAFMNNTMAECKTFLGTVTYMSPERIHNAAYSYPADIWSLGLCLVELATGKYPFDATCGPLQLMIHVTEEDAPLPPAGEYSEELRDFIRQCLHKDPTDRPTADALLRHAYIRKHAQDKVDMRAFMQCMFSPHDKLDEIAMVFAYNFYKIFNEGVQRLKDLAPLYASNTLMTRDGEMSRGRDAIIAKLQSVAQMHAGFRVVHEVDDVVCQPLGLDGTALVSVSGALRAPLAGQPPQPFEELFVLSQSRPGEYYVANQVFRMS